MILARSLKTGSYHSVDLEANFTHLVSYLQQYADKGLRTLVMSVKELTADSYRHAIIAVNKAETVVENRDEIKAQWYMFPLPSHSSSYETLETKLIPVGISGIEDLLQDEVYETIDVLFSNP